MYLNRFFADVTHVCVTAVAHHVVAALVLHERLVAAGTLSVNGTLYFNGVTRLHSSSTQFKRSKNSLTAKRIFFFLVQHI
jgi:hypothetical protein